MSAQDDEDQLLRSVALQNANSILVARRRADDQLVAAKEELAATNARITSILDSITDGFIVLDDQWRLTFLNQRAEALLRPFRTGTDRLLGASFWDACPAFVGTTLETQYRRAVLEQVEVQFEVHDAQLGKWFEVRAFPARGLLTAYFQDVTRRKQDEQALRDEARTLEIINETGKTLASTLDVQTLVQAVTDAATELSGAKFGAFFYTQRNADNDVFMLYTLSGAPREAFERFGHPRATPLFGPTFRGEGVIRLDDVRKDPRFGQWGPHKGMPPGHLPVVSYLAVPVRTRAGEVIGGLFFGHPEPGRFDERCERMIVAVAAQAGVAMDNARLYESAQRAATERERLLESERAARTQAEHASRMKDEFLSVLSHELRTPLNAILGWSNLLRSKVTDDEVTRGLITIERNARTQNQLIEDLLDMSRINAGNMRLDVKPVDPSVSIDAAIETVRPAADAKQIKLAKVIDPAARPIHGDAGRLQQIVWNLLSNAIKFTPPGGDVKVRLERVGEYVELSVADTGQGIDPQFLPYVFDRFRQADSTTTRRHGGLGLGLAIVKHLVELHGGTIHVDSPGPGLGATFCLRLPATANERRVDSPSAEDGSSARTALQAADLAGITVVVVDDETDTRELVAELLELCGARVFSAGNAAEALLLVERERPNVLVSDIGMPDVDGYELLRRVRALGEAKNGRVPAIALTAFARSEDRMRALRAGYLVHLAKPVEPSELVATVASVAGRAGLNG